MKSHVIHLSIYSSVGKDSMCIYAEPCLLANGVISENERPTQKKKRKKKGGDEKRDRDRPFWVENMGKRPETEYE